MKKFYETRLESAFHVEALIGVSRNRRLRKHGLDSPAFKDGRIGVVYDFWQLIYMEEGSYHCQIEGNPPACSKPGSFYYANHERSVFPSKAARLFPGSSASAVTPQRCSG